MSMGRDPKDYIEELKRKKEQEQRAKQEAAAQRLIDRNARMQRVRDIGQKWLAQAQAIVKQSGERVFLDIVFDNDETGFTLLVGKPVRGERKLVVRSRENGKWVCTTHSLESGPSSVTYYNTDEDAEGAREIDVHPVVDEVFRALVNKTDRPGPPGPGATMPPGH